MKRKRYFKGGGQAKRKPVTKPGKSNNKKSNSPTLNDSKTLQQLRSDNMYMTTKAKGIMISFVKNLYKWVSVEAERLRRERKRTSIGRGFALYEGILKGKKFSPSPWGEKERTRQGEGR
ncbi:Histone H2B type 3-B, partial [Ophiophagus hannah]